jgi:hypothetical protein
MPEERQSDSEPTKERETKKPVQRNFTYTQPPGGLPSVYANNCALSPSPFDLRFYFGEMAGGTEDASVIAQKVEVIVTWVEAKIIAAFLQKSVEAFEKKNGPINLPLMPDPPQASNPFGEGSEAQEIATGDLK